MSVCVCIITKNVHILPKGLILFIFTQKPNFMGTTIYPLGHSSSLIHLNGSTAFFSKNKP